MARKTVRFDQDGLQKLPDDKPVVYKILSPKGENIHTGSAQRGRVRERLSEHLTDGPDFIAGGAKVQIEQHASIDEARAKESRVIARSKPRLNKKGK
jgi:hypothetical protein